MTQIFTINIFFYSLSNGICLVVDATDLLFNSLLLEFSEKKKWIYTFLMHLQNENFYTKLPFLIPYQCFCFRGKTTYWGSIAMINPIYARASVRGIAAEAPIWYPLVLIG
jgi:hypothetical protein